MDELKNGLHTDRLSCHRFMANFFRLLLHTAAYNLLNAARDDSRRAPGAAGRPALHLADEPDQGGRRGRADHPARHRPTGGTVALASVSPAEPWPSYQAVSARAIAHLSTAASSVTPPAAFAPSS